MRLTQVERNSQAGGKNYHIRQHARFFLSQWRLHTCRLHMLQEIDCVQPLHKMLGFRCWHILCNKIKG